MSRHRHGHGWIRSYRTRTCTVRVVLAVVLLLSGCRGVPSTPVPPPGSAVTARATPALRFPSGTSRAIGITVDETGSVDPTQIDTALQQAGAWLLALVQPGQGRVEVNVWAITSNSITDQNQLMDFSFGPVSLVPSPPSAVTPAATAAFTLNPRVRATETAAADQRARAAEAAAAAYQALLTEQTQQVQQVRDGLERQLTALYAIRRPIDAHATDLQGAIARQAAFLQQTAAAEQYLFIATDLAQVGPQQVSQFTSLSGVHVVIDELCQTTAVSCDANRLRYQQVLRDLGAASITVISPADLAVIPNPFSAN